MDANLYPALIRGVGLEWENVGGGPLVGPNLRNYFSLCPVYLGQLPITTIIEGGEKPTYGVGVGPQLYLREQGTSPSPLS